MCHLETVDKTCFEEGCINIVQYQGPYHYNKCSHVRKNNLEFGACGKRKQRKLPGSVRSQSRQFCPGCSGKAVKEQNELYENLEQHLAESREVEQNRDDERRHRDAERRSATPQAAAAEQQGSLVFGAGMHASPELDGLFEDITQQGWEDPGEGASAGWAGGWDDPGEGPSRAGGEGHN